MSASRPGEVQVSQIDEVFRGIGQGQVRVSGTLARAETVGTSSTYPARIPARGLDADQHAKLLIQLEVEGQSSALIHKLGAGSTEEIEEERRLLYVAMTRPKYEPFTILELNAFELI